MNNSDSKQSGFTSKPFWWIISKQKEESFQGLSPLQVASIYLKVAAEGCMVQRGPAGSVRHVHIAEQRDEGFGTAHSLVRCGDVERRLPVLVSGIYIRRVFQQHLDGLLQKYSNAPLHYEPRNCVNVWIT